LIGVVWVVARMVCELKETRWNSDDWKDFLSFMFTWAIPGVMGMIFFGYIFTGLTYQLTAAMLTQVFIAPMGYTLGFPISFVLMLCIFATPIWGLQYVMMQHVKRARNEAKEEHSQMPVYTYDLNKSTDKLLTEPSHMVVLRSIAVFLGGIAFLMLLQLGVQMVPNTIGFWASAFFALGVVGITLACVITCYPSLREGYRQLETERSKALAAYREAHEQS
jgi:hypothetical protein